MPENKMSTEFDNERPGLQKLIEEHKKRVFENFYKMKMNDQYTDVSLKIFGSDEAYNVHSIMLVAVSSVFDKLIQTKCKTVDGTFNFKNKLPVDLPKCITTSAMNVLLHFIYSGDVNIIKEVSFEEETLEKYRETMKAAKYLKINLLGQYLKKLTSSSDSIFPCDNSDDESYEGDEVAPIKSDEEYSVSLKHDPALLPRRKRLPRKSHNSLDKILRKLNSDNEDSETEEDHSSLLHPETGVLNDDTPVETTKIKLQALATSLIPHSSNKFITKVIRSDKDKLKVRKKYRKVHFCTECNLSYKTMVTFNNHKHWHFNKGFKCDRCKQSFLSHEVYDKHKEQHQLDSKFQCSICSHKFSTPYVLKLHTRTHTGNELYSCEVCKKKFPYKTSLKTHMLIHNAIKDFTCSICGKRFTQKIHAKNHERQHSGLKLYNCHICHQSFAHHSGLSRHLSDIHRKERKYCCDKCGKTFPRKSKLQAHERTHTGEKPYICDICGTGYKANRSLKAHKKQLHKIDVPKYQVGISHRLKPEVQKSIKGLQKMQDAISSPLAVVQSSEPSQKQSVQFIHISTTKANEVIMQDQESHTQLNYTNLNSVQQGGLPPISFCDANQLQGINQPIDIVQSAQILSNLHIPEVHQQNNSVILQTQPPTHFQYNNVPVTNITQQTKPTFIVPLTAGKPTPSNLLVTYAPQQPHLVIANSTTDNSIQAE